MFERREAWQCDDSEYRERSYAKPKIKRLGSLSELTRSNQAGQNDSFFGTGGDQTGPQRPPNP